MSPAEQDAARRAELAAFLRARRRALRPEDVGLAGGGRRRVGGLRREEVSQLASISMTWLTQIEQARDVHPTGQVLDALARALRLSVDEHLHLRRLGGRPMDTDEESLELPGPVRTLVETADTPALVGTWWGDILAWNRGYVALTGLDPDGLPDDRRNWLWANFAEGVRRPDHIEHREIRDEMLVAGLRYAAAGRTGHPRLLAVVDAVSAASDRFRTLWSGQSVRRSSIEEGSLAIRVNHVQLAVPSHPSLRLMFFVPVDDVDRHYLEKVVLSAPLTVKSS